METVVRNRPRVLKRSGAVALPKPAEKAKMPRFADDLRKRWIISNAFRCCMLSVVIGMPVYGGSLWFSRPAIYNAKTFEVALNFMPLGVWSALFVLVGLTTILSLFKSLLWTQAVTASWSAAMSFWVILILLGSFRSGIYTGTAGAAYALVSVAICSVMCGERKNNLP